MFCEACFKDGGGVVLLLRLGAMIWVRRSRVQEEGEMMWPLTFASRLTKTSLSQPT